jgi:DNA polymerase-3 subunit epsilon
VERQQWLIRPPRQTFTLTSIHGLRWNDVRHARTFAEVWADARVMLHGADYLAAHNASFDRRVLAACCTAANLEPPPFQFLCSLRMSKQTWSLPAYRLPELADHLGIELEHHDAASDAGACAQIVVAAKARSGWSAEAFFLKCSGSALRPPSDRRPERTSGLPRRVSGH